MARRREFDVDEAVGKAMRLFWRKGYAETSVRELVAATGVAHAGLYAAFGDKRGLFQASLRRYVDEVVCVFDRLEAPEAGRATIEHFFHEVVAAADGGSFQNGCLVANTAVELGAGDADHGEAVERLVTRVLQRQLRAFAHALRQAVTRGETRPELDVEDTASTLAAVFYGLSALARAGASPATLEAAARGVAGLLH